jgi:hypothetical protein
MGSRPSSRPRRDRAARAPEGQLDHARARSNPVIPRSSPKVAAQGASGTTPRSRSAACRATSS